MSPSLRPELAPEWLHPMLQGAQELDPTRLGLHRVPPRDARPAAVLILFGDETEHGPDVLLMERASTLREHAGQVAFPGGGADPGDADTVATALREAEEETGVDPAGVVPLAVMHELYVPPSGYAVTPVIAHWARPVAVRAVDPGETASVVRAPLAHLADPEHRIRVRHTSGYTGPAFTVAGLLVWGFTGGILSALLDLGGWARPWDSATVHDLGDAWSAARTAGRQEVAGS